MTDLPEGWEVAELSDVADVLDFRRVPVNAKERAERSGNVPYYGATGQVGWIDDALFDEELVLLGEDGAPFLDPSKQKAYLISGPAWVNNHAHVLRGRTGIASNRYLKYALDVADYRAHVNGTTRLKLTQNAMRAMRLLLPPQAEQGRIVAAIEEHLSRLDAAGSSLVAAQDRVTLLGQQLVDEALEGPTVRLGDLLREPLRNGLSAPTSAVGSVRVVTLTAVTKAKFIQSHTKLIEPGDRGVDDLWMKPGDIFIQRSNTPELVGSSAIYRGPESWAIFPDLLIRVRVGERIDPDYLTLALRSTRLRRYFQRSAQGIAGSMPKISQPIVEAAEVPVPIVERQREIVAQVFDRQESMRRLGADLQLARARMSALRRSILAAAFLGQLVPQDPDDEPASALLDRIRAERAEQQPGQRRTRAVRG